jgi:hypothetical protein
MTDLDARLLAFARETLFHLATRYEPDIDAIAADALDRDLLTTHHQTGHLQMAPELDLDAELKTIASFAKLEDLRPIAEGHDFFADLPPNYFLDAPDHWSGPGGCHPDCPACARELATHGHLL